jgi:glutamate/tyrosine decarboxylase-like PLP-dependent enzyme
MTGDHAYSLSFDQYRTLLAQAEAYALEYLRDRDARPVFPDAAALEGLAAFDEPLPPEPEAPDRVLARLHRQAAPATVSQSGGRYFGFVIGGLLPVAHAAQWLADTWNQNAALHLMSPAVAKLEEICEKWLVDLLGLTPGTAMGLVSGSSNATLCALAAARNTLLARQGYDAAERGLAGCPPIRVVMGEGAHASIPKALSILGLGRDQITVVPADERGAVLAEKFPPLDGRTLVILQAGHVSGGAFDPLEPVLRQARPAGAWVHVDGAIGLWAAASERRRHLVRGLAEADSLTADGHKVLNVGYDSGLVFCRDREAYTAALRASGSYIPYGPHRDGMRYTTEMSRRARAVALWAVLKSLGRRGVEQLVDSLCDQAAYFGRRLAEAGFTVLTPVVFNQLLLACGRDRVTEAVLKAVQGGGPFWCGGAVWRGRPVIRVSVCSWRTTAEDVDRCLEFFVRARSEAEAGERDREG